MLVGHCGVTSQWSSRADTHCCESSGYLKLDSGLLRKNWTAATLWCEEQCLRCSRCVYVSLSLRNAECSWYAECQERHRRDDWRTLQVRQPGPASRTSRQACERDAAAREGIAPLSRAALERSLPALAQPEAWRGLFARLHAGLPMTLGIFGASVAQNAGCLTQPAKRCMGIRGYAVRLLEHINGTGS